MKPNELPTRLAETGEQVYRKIARVARPLGKISTRGVQRVLDIGHSVVGQETYETLRHAANINSVNGCLTRRGMFRAIDAMLETESPDELLISYVDIVF